jgi:hypothetical protein
VLLILAVGCRGSESHGKERPPIEDIPYREPVVTYESAGPSSAIAGATLHAQVPTSWKVDLRGMGPVHYGMSLTAASRVLGETLSFEPTEPEGGCGYVRPSAAPRGVAFMVIDTLIERVDVYKGDVTTLSGAHIGSTEDEVKAMYPARIEVEPHPYNPEGHYLVYSQRDSSNAGYRIIFETNGRAVIRFRAGRRPAVDYIEGCS